MPQIKKDEIRNALLETAASEFMSKGFKDASIRKIGEIAGVSKSNLYTYFRNKDHLFEELVKPAVIEIEGWFKDIDRPERFGEDTWGLNYHLELIEGLADFIDRRRMELYLIVFKSFGSSFQNYYNNFIGRCTALNIKNLPYYAEKMNFKNRNVSKFFTHNLAASYAGFIKELLMHNVQRKEILIYGKEFMTYSYCGSASLYGYEEWLDR